MKKDNWPADGDKIIIPNLGECLLWHRMIDNEYHQYKIKYGYSTFIGDYSYDKITALNNTLDCLKKRFKSFF